MPDESQEVGQDEIEQLLRASQQDSPPAPAKSASAQAPESAVPSDELEPFTDRSQAPHSAEATSSASTQQVSGGSVEQSDIDLLLNKAEKALASIDQGQEDADKLPPGIRSFEFERFAGTAANQEVATLEMMRDVELDMTIELGRTHMHLEDVLQLKKGAVVPLDKLAGDPADILVNGRLIARGEVLVLNDNFCIRVAELIASESAGT